MTTLPSDDPLLVSLGRLPAATPERSHADHVRERCHAVLAERRRGRASRWPSVEPRRLETVLVGAFGLVYIVAVLHAAARLFR